MESAAGRMEGLTNEEKKLDRQLRVDKTRILENIIFPSMVNLTFFLECISNHKDLQNVFDNDLKELFGIKRNEPRAYNYAFMLEIYD